MKRHEEFTPNYTIDVTKGVQPPSNDGVSGPGVNVPADPGGAGLRNGPFEGGTLDGSTAYPKGD